MRGNVQLLGTGTSAGVPVIGCTCKVCSSKAKEDQRFRPSALINIDGKSLLIDMGPDFRSQALKFHIHHLDGLILTHTHYDHIAGIDESRVFNIRQKKPLPCLLSKESFKEIEKRYDYLFDPHNASAKFEFFPFDELMGKVTFLGVEISYASFFQSKMKVTGYRFGDFAYISDIKKYDEMILDVFAGVNHLVISALRSEPSPFHLSLDEAVEVAKKLKAKKTWITHVGHFETHEEMNALLPQDVRIAYDGLKLDIA